MDRNLKLSQTILELYKGSRDWPAAHFQDRAFVTIQGVIQFDSAMWGSGTNDPNVIHNVHLFHQPQAMMDNYMRFQDKDMFRMAVCATPGVSVNLTDIISRAELVKTEIYREHGRLFGIEQVLGTALIDPVSHLFSFMSLWRKSPKRPFTERDRLTKTFLMPHLMESYHANRIRCVGEAYSGEHRARYSVCICYKLGILHQAEGRAISLLRKEWRAWKNAQLPDELRQLVGGRTKTIFSGKHVFIEIGPVQELFFLRVRAKEPMDMLTAREQSIARYFAQGSNHREVAELLGISSSTVRNHINAVYKKLGLHNKAELARRLHDLVE